MKETLILVPSTVAKLFVITGAEEWEEVSLI